MIKCEKDSNSKHNNVPNDKKTTSSRMQTMLNFRFAYRHAYRNFIEGKKSVYRTKMSPNRSITKDNRQQSSKYSLPQSV